MAYFLGRDVVVAITTEDAHFGIGLDGGDTGGLSVLDMTGSGAAGAPDVTTADTIFAGARAQLDGSSSVFNTQDTGSAADYSNEVSDLVGVDISLGVTDEDINYLGQRSVLKAEIKKETTVTLTVKKSSKLFDMIFNEARYGVKGPGASDYHDGLTSPDQSDFGYRVYVKLKDSAEVISIPNTCIQAHSVSLNADGVTEETLEFMTYLNPTVGTADVITETTSF
tara:strand:- start:2718 stop:3389 length:672 start_codon:yes stop_codon:yes gene_type:complete